MIETERFTLKELTLSDANEKYLSWFCDDDVKKFIENHPKTTVDLVGFITHCNKNKLILLLGVFTKNETHIGNIKFEFDKKIPFQVTMGIMIGDPQWRGMGVASEVILESGSFLNQQFNIKKILLGVDKDNLPAIKSYKKIGFKEDKKGELTTSFISMAWALPD